MATSYIRPSGGGDYTSFAAWAAAITRVPGDVAICDEAGAQTLPVTIAVSDQTMRATVSGVIVRCSAPNIPLSVDSGITGFVCEGVELDQTGIGVGALTFQADSGLTMTDCTIGGDTYAVYAAVNSTGTVVLDGCTFAATDPSSVAIRATSFADLTMRDCTLTAVETGLWANSLAGRIERCKIRVGLYPIKASGTWVGIGGDLNIESCELQCNATAGGGTALTFDTYTIPTGKTLTFANCTLVGSTANVLAAHNGLLIDPQNSPLPGTFTMRNIIISGFAAPYRVTGIPAGQDYCDVAPVPLNGTTPIADLYPNKAYVAGANDIAVDPDFFGATDFRLTGGSPCLGAGVDVGVVYDCDGLAFDSPPPIGAYIEADSTRPDVTAAVPTGSATVTVTFSEPVTGADLTNAAAWAISTPVAGPAAVTVLSATQTAADTVVLSVSTMDASALYRATCPATVTDLAGNLIDERNGDFVTGLWYSEDSGDPWAATPDGTSADIGTAPFELIDWTADSTTSLARLVWISLFSNRRAEDGDTVPDDGGDPVYRGGWAGDSYGDNGRKLGSRLWLLLNQPITDATPARAVAYMNEALEWMRADGLVSRFECQAERIGMQALGVGVTLYDRANNQVANLWYDDLWEVYRG